jgi:hypothetical protein
MWAGLLSITEQDVIRHIKEGLAHATDADPLYIRGSWGTVDTNAVYARALVEVPRVLFEKRREHRVSQ